MQKTIQEAVVEKITSCGENVANIVIDKLAEIEISKRVDTVFKAIQKQEQLEKELKKVDRDDIVSYSNGEKVTSMSELRFKVIKKSKDAIENLKKTISDCLEKNDFDSYKKLNGQIVENKPEGSGENKPEGSGENK